MRTLLRITWNEKINISVLNGACPKIWLQECIDETNTYLYDTMGQHGDEEKCPYGPQINDGKHQIAPTVEDRDKWRTGVGRIPCGLM